MKILLAIFLGLIALFTGGCSLFFMLSLGTYDRSSASMIWGSGLLIAGVCIWGVWALLKPSAPKNPPEQGPNP